jgi:hypothetical protein
VRKQLLKYPKTSEVQETGKVHTTENEGVLTGLGSSRDVIMWTERQRLDVTGVGISQQFVLCSHLIVVEPPFNAHFHWF